VQKARSLTVNMLLKNLTEPGNSTRCGNLTVNQDVAGPSPTPRCHFMSKRPEYVKFLDEFEANMQMGRKIKPNDMINLVRIVRALVRSY